MAWGRQKSYGVLLANERLRDQTASNLGWNSRICG
jgi:hypothetical protein